MTAISTAQTTITITTNSIQASTVLTDTTNTTKEKSRKVAKSRLSIRDKSLASNS